MYYPIMLFVMVYEVVLTFESVDETFKCDYSEPHCFVSSTN